MPATVVTVDRDVKPGIVPVLRGFWLVFENFFRSFVLRQVATIEYPEQRRAVGPRYRGVHILTARLDGTPKCVACYLCATVCPAECIFIEAGERPEATIEKYPTRFEIDLLRCVYCGFCVDACPEEAIVMSGENDLVGTSREELVIGRDALMARARIAQFGPGYRPEDHDVHRPVRIGALEHSRTE